MSRRDILKFVTDYLSKTKGFEKYLKNIKYLSLQDGKCKAEYVLTEHDVNSEGHFHGGLAASLVDFISTNTLLMHGDGFLATSTNIHITNFQSALSGEVLSIDAKLCRHADPLAFLELEIKKKNGGALVLRGQHTVVTRPWNNSKF